MKRFFKRLLALALCGGMLLVSAPAAFAEESIDDLNDRYKQLQAEADALQAKVDNAKTERAKQEAIKEKTTQEIGIIRSQIAVLEQKITALEEEIAHLYTVWETLAAELEEMKA